MTNRFRTKITDMLGCEHPILCGGMQWVSRAEFVAAVCNAGAFGFITAESFDTAEHLRAEIRKMRDLTDRPFGVNVSMVPEFGVPDRTIRFCEVICEEGVLAVETAGRSPEPLMPLFREAGVKVIHKITSVRHALKAQALGVDAVTLVGIGSGGHVGLDNVVAFVLIPQAVARLDIPVIAGGAVANGRGFLGALAMGAEAVLMGTAFFATQEAPVHPNIKQRVVQAEETDTSLIMSSIKNPIRCVNNKLVADVLAVEARGTTLAEILGLVAGGKGKLAYQSGDPDTAPIACGQVAGLIGEVKSVARLVEDIITEAGQLLDRLNRLAG
ncbi:MAG: nitronate monooxygenase family protein [Proteobacteria bacterium]|nr:nitronate monooxygenase family protein [Pseudomonadota bacterium]